MSVATQSISDTVFRALTESAPDGIVLVNQEGRIILVNERNEKLFGFPRAELLGQAVEILVPARLRGKHRGHRAGFTGHPQSHPWARASSCTAFAKTTRNSRLKSA